MKNGKRCVSCLPSCLDTCSNYESGLPQSSIRTASAHSSVAVQHVTSSVLSASSLAAFSTHHSPPRTQSPGCTNFSYHVVSLSPSSPQSDLVNYTSLLSLQTTTMPDLDSIFLPKLPTLQNILKGVQSAWASLLSNLYSEISNNTSNLSSGLSSLCSPCRCIVGSPVKRDCSNWQKILFVVLSRSRCWKAGEIRT